MPMKHKLQLNDIAEVFNGKTPSKAEQRSVGHPVLKIKDVDDAGQFVGRYDCFVDNDFASGFHKKLIRSGDTLILNAAHNADYVGSKRFLVNGSAVGALATGEWLIVRPRTELADATFVHFWLQYAGTKKRISELVKGIHLYPSDVAQIFISLPTLREQRQISKILMAAQRVGQLHGYALQLCDALLRSAFIEMFGDPISNPKKLPVMALEDLALIQRGRFSPRPRNDPSYYGGEYPFIQTGDISESGGLVTRWKQTLNDRGIKVSKCFPAGTIVIAIVGATIGMTSILGIPVYCPDSVVGIQTDPRRTRPEYLEYLLRFWRPVFLAQAPETARANINLETLRPVKILAPSIDQQEKFTTLVRAYSRFRIQHTEARRQAVHLLESLLRHSFESN